MKKKCKRSHVPNKETVKALKESAKNLKRFKSFEELLDDLKSEK